MKDLKRSYDSHFTLYHLFVTIWSNEVTVFLTVLRTEAVRNERIKSSYGIACSQTLYFLFKDCRARVDLLTERGRSRAVELSSVDRLLQ